MLCVIKNTRCNVGGLLESEMMEYIPVPWRHKKSEQKWAEAILSKRSAVRNIPDWLTD